MKYLYECRRTFIAFFAICVLAWLGYRGADVASIIGFIVAAVAGANAAQGVLETKKEEKAE
jgi:hypothetical protein